MRIACWMGLLLASGSACKSHDAAPAPSAGSGSSAAPAPVPRQTGPMPIAFGDCVTVETAWTSGPRPTTIDRNGTGRALDPAAAGILVGPPSDLAAQLGIGSDDFAAPVPPARPVPIANQALRPYAAELATCFRLGTRPYGVAVVALAFDAHGTATSTVAHGDVDGTVQACIAAATKSARPNPAGATALHCSLAFGEMPVTALPTIDVGPATDRVSFAGAAVHGDTTSIMPLMAAVSYAFDAHARGRAARAPDGVAIDGPFVVQPDPETPWATVEEVLLGAGDDDVLLATHDGPVWRVLDAVEPLPVVPVPVGLGVHHSPLKRYASSTVPSDPDRVTLAIVLQPDRIWIGLSGGRELSSVPRATDQVVTLFAALQAQKASGLFSDRTDIEIAVDAEVPYRDVVGLVDAATHAGFTDWLLTTRADVGARRQP